MSSSPSANRGWIVTFAGLGINLVLGALYAWGVVAKALVMQWKWTKADAGLPFAICTASFAVMMIFAGRMQDKMGPRRVAQLGGLLFGAGLAASGFVNTPLTMALTFGVLGGIGIGLGYSATTPPAMKWFPPARKGLITGLVVAGVGSAAIYISPLTQWLLGRTTIQNTFLTLGAGAFVLILLFSLLLENPPAGYKPAGSAPAAGSAARPAAAVHRDRDWPEMLRTPQFYLLWLIYVLSATAGLMLIANAPIIAKEQAAWEAGFVGVMILAAFNTIGRILAGSVSDRFGRTRTMILAFVLQAVNMALFVTYKTPAMMMFGTAFTGLCYGTIFTLMPAATADFYGVRNLGVNYGFVFTGFGVAGVLGSRYGGMIRDLFGSFSKAYLICAAMLIVAAMLAFCTKAPKPSDPRTT
ncbi:MAG: OFA family MFS transporter [Opitutaceae bacterium]|nr:OFA family MFS transporter [Opitutaceae bacterium]